MTLHANLLRDDCQAVAGRIKASITRVKGPQCVVVRPNGRVRIFQQSKLPIDDLDNLIGAYRKDCPVEVIEDDLLAHLRQITA